MRRAWKGTRRAREARARHRAARIAAYCATHGIPLPETIGEAMRIDLLEFRERLEEARVRRG